MVFVISNILAAEQRRKERVFNDNLSKGNPFAIVRFLEQLRIEAVLREQQFEMEDSEDNDVQAVDPVESSQQEEEHVQSDEESSQGASSSTHSVDGAMRERILRHEELLHELGIDEILERSKREQ